MNVHNQIGGNVERPPPTRTNYRAMVLCGYCVCRDPFVYPLDGYRQVSGNRRPGWPQLYQGADSGNFLHSQWLMEKTSIRQDGKNFNGSITPDKGI